MTDSDAPDEAAPVEKGSRTHTSPSSKVGDRVRALLVEHPELAHSPSKIARILSILLGSAKRVAAAWCKEQTWDSFGPVLLQNIYFIGPNYGDITTLSLTAAGTKRIALNPCGPYVRATGSLSGTNPTVSGSGVQVYGKW